MIVVIGSDLYGDSIAIADDLSAHGVAVLMSYRPPLGTVVTVHFQHVRELGMDEMVARAEVISHRASRAADCGFLIGLRFVEFVERAEPVGRLH